MKIFILLLAFSLLTFSQKKVKKPFRKLIARSSEFDSFNMPAQSPLRGINPQINNKDEVLFKVPVSSFQETEKIFYHYSSSKNKRKKRAVKIFETKPNEYLSDPFFSKKGIIFYTFDVAGTKHVYLKSKKSKPEIIFTPSKHQISMIFEIFSYGNDLYFRGKDSQGKLGIYKYQREEKTVSPIFTVGQKYRNKEIFYIFPLAMKGNFATCKVRLAGLDEKNPEVLLRLNFETNKHKVIASNKLFKKSSIFTSFRNSAAINKNGSIAFIALSKGERSLFLNRLSQEHITTPIVTPEGKLKSFQHFPPSINANNSIAFRGLDSKNRENIYLANKDKTGIVLKKFQYIYTEKKEKSVVMHEKETPPFGGIPAINDKNTIISNISLRTLDPYTLNPTHIQSGILMIKNPDSYLK